MAIRVLLVQGAGESRDKLAAMLNELGLEPNTASTAEEATERCRAAKPNIFVINLNLPGGADGVQLIQQLLTENPSVKIVAISNDPESETYFRVLRARGVKSTIALPTNTDQLASAIERATGVSRNDFAEELIG